MEKMINDKKTTFSYDKANQLVTATDADGKKTSYKYDEFDRLAKKTVLCVETKETSVWNYTYTANGKTKSLVAIFPDGTKRTIKYSYDKFGRMEGIVDGQDKVKYSYDKKSMLASQEINGVPVTYSYTKYGQLESKIMGDVKSPIATLKYTYAKDGTITSREINGNIQKYVYDAKNQLSKVVGIDGKAVETYAYDSAGNILEKNINGEITKFTYDKANQLVSSTQPDGSVKKYAYDAAGRMISESSDNSNKLYNYAWQDKVVSIDNNGAKVNFEYYPDGQLAQKMTGKDTERFYWDGLALMKRDSSEYTIEPAATGGNPIIADGKVLFNDILGSTVGYQDNNQFNPITRTAFGQVTSDKANLDFFTGKPNVEGLGYNFLFRNYRQDLGKWQTADPLGYPDGLNNFAYGNNNVFNGFDQLGGKWGTAEMTAYYYRLYGADYLDTDDMGLTGDTWNAIEINNIVGRVTNQIDAKIQTLLKGKNGFGSDKTTYGTSGSYSFYSVCYAFGMGAVFTMSSISYSWVAICSEICYAWSSTTTISYQDAYVDPLDTGLEFGNPYGFGHVWNISLSKSGSIPE